MSTPIQTRNHTKQVCGLISVTLMKDFTETIIRLDKQLARTSAQRQALLRTHSLHFFEIGRIGARLAVES